MLKIHKTKGQSASRKQWWGPGLILSQNNNLKTEKSKGEGASQKLWWCPGLIPSLPKKNMISSQKNNPQLRPGLRKTSQR